MASTRTTSSTDVHDVALDRVQCDDRLARRFRGCPAAASSSPTAMRLMPAGCSRRSASTIISTTSTTSTPAAIGPSPTRTATRCCASGSGSIPDHALLADDMAQNLAPAKALGMTTVWVDNGSERGNHGYDESFIDHRDRRCRRMARKHLGGRDMNDELQAAIDRAWEEREIARPGYERRSPPGGRHGARRARSRRGADRREGRRRMDRPPVAEEGRAAVLPAQPDGSDLAGGARRRALVGQGPVQIRRLGRDGNSARPASASSPARSSAAAPISRPARC